MAYPLRTNNDGSILWSDGTVTNKPALNPNAMFPDTGASMQSASIVTPYGPPAGSIRQESGSLVTDWQTPKYSEWIKTPAGQNYTNPPLKTSPSKIAGSITPTDYVANMATLEPSQSYSISQEDLSKLNPLSLSGIPGLNFSGLISQLPTTISSGSLQPLNVSNLNLKLPTASETPNFASLLSGDQYMGTKGVGTSYNNPRGYTISGTGNLKMSSPLGETVKLGTQEEVNKEKASTSQDIQSLVEKAKTITDPMEAINALNSQIWGIQQEALADQSGDLQKYFDAKKQLLEDQYNRNITEANALIPQYESERDLEIQKQNEALESAKATAETAKTSLLNKQGSDVRNVWQNQKAAQQRMSNIYSALGTVESSDFLNRANQLEATGLTQQAETERFYGGEVAKIEQQVVDLEKGTKDQIDSIMNAYRAAIDKVRRDVTASEQEKADNLELLITQYAADMTELKNTYASSQAQLLQNKADLLNQKAIIDWQGQQQMGYANYINSLSRQIPALDQSDLSELGRPYSSVTKRAAADRLKQKYPMYADMIDAVYQGAMSIDQLVAQIQGELGQNNFASMISGGVSS